MKTFELFHYEEKGRNFLYVEGRIRAKSLREARVTFTAMIAAKKAAGTKKFEI